MALRGVFLELRTICLSVFLRNDPDDKIGEPETLSMKQAV